MINIWSKHLPVQQTAERSVMLRCLHSVSSWSKHSSIVGVNNDSYGSIWSCLTDTHWFWRVVYNINWLFSYTDSACPAFFVPASFGYFLKFLQHLTELWWKPNGGRRSCSRVKYWNGLCRFRVERSLQVQRLVLALSQVPCVGCDLDGHIWTCFLWFLWLLVCIYLILIYKRNTIQ